MDLTSLAQLQTEGVNPRTIHIDRMSTLEMCMVINDDDHRVAESVKECLPEIARAIEALAPRVRQGGRVVYVGAGTSGRLGILDASEIPPTFAAPHSQFIGIIAGGDAAIRQAQEGAEDNAQAGEDDLERLNLDPELDSVIGIASSGRTPYVLGCLAYAKRRGCVTIGVACASPSAMSRCGDVDFLIAPLPGPEVVTGSTRLKSGTATKLVLNMLSTGTMIRVGKTYGNMMVDMVASNLKLEQRSRNMLRRLSPKCNSMSDSELDALLAQSKRSVKLAMLVAETGQTIEICQRHLDSAGGVLAAALDEACPSTQTVSPNDNYSKRFALCIDGGGTKCAAAIADIAGNMSHGYAGPCNLTDGIGNVPGVVATLVDATKNALKGHLPNGTEPSDAEWKQYLRSCFRSVWVGLAGLDRAGVHKTLTPILAEMFGLDHTTADFRLTSDVDLLPASVSVDHNPCSILVLIAGTGSVAMRYAWKEGRGYIRVARSGGWGHMLGDEGGGYSIGLEAIKHTLLVLEEQTLDLRPPGLDALEEAVIRKLGCATSMDGRIDVLSHILAGHHQETFKTRISQLAETVVELALHDKTAEAIVKSQISHLVTKTVGRLADSRSSGYAAAQETELILAGGLMRNEGYQRTLREQLNQRGLQFSGIRVVGDVATAGAKSLWKKNE
ncbi:putative glucokinase regulator family protein [Penicillium brasilianum]|uniref:N-acetyl-D-glucosamine kinase n=1 Tax=Penicillium brasilianum TaxID=104259 RepID=A0A1S9RYM1_PENBI|nr:putative glucokinase regulator family protein [Penicillium brasilianum]